MTTPVQVGETARDRANFCRCFKTAATVFLHDDGVVAHSTYRNTPSEPCAPARTNCDTRGCAPLSGKQSVWVKLRRTRCEQMFSGLPLIADVGSGTQHAVRYQGAKVQHFSRKARNCPDSSTGHRMAASRQHPTSAFLLPVDQASRFTPDFAFRLP